jgi:hypothetical protein
VFVFHCVLTLFVYVSDVLVVVCTVDPSDGGNKKGSSSSDSSSSPQWSSSGASVSPVDVALRAADVASRAADASVNAAWMQAPQDRPLKTLAMKTVESSSSSSSSSSSQASSSGGSVSSVDVASRAANDASQADDALPGAVNAAWMRAPQDRPLKPPLMKAFEMSAVDGYDAELTSNLEETLLRKQKGGAIGAAALRLLSPVAPSPSLEEVDLTHQSLTAKVLSRLQPSGRKTSSKTSRK